MEWVPFTVDRFANGRNNKVTRFYSKFFETGSEGVDAFLFSWANENNLFVPPIAEICRVIKRFREENVTGTMVVPYWPGAAFWTLLKRGSSWEYFLVDAKVFPNGKKCISRGNCPFSLLGYRPQWPLE